MEFVCRVGTPDGRVTQQVREAADEGSVRSQLEKSGYHVFEVKPKGINLSVSRIRGRKRIKDQDLLIFNQELAGLLRAGLPLLQALDMLLERDRGPEFTGLLRDVRDRVKSGEELSEAFSAAGSGMFPPLYTSTLMAGERSGELEQVLRRFIRYQKLVIGTRKRIVSAFAYPTLLVFLSVAMIVVMVVFVLPSFEGFYESMQVELPLPTRVLLAISAFAQQRGLWVVLGAIAAVWLMRRWTTTETGATWRDRLILRLPLAGGIVHRFSLSEFSRSLSTLLAGGLPLLPSLEVATSSVGNAHLRRKLQPMVPRVREGAALHEAMDESGVATELAVDLVRVGEATGALDEMLANVSDFFDDEVETKVQRFLALIEPIMLMIMGIAVALLLLAMYMPLFSVLGKVQ